MIYRRRARGRPGC